MARDTPARSTRTEYEGTIMSLICSFRDENKTQDRGRERGKRAGGGRERGVGEQGGGRERGVGEQGSVVACAC